MQWFDADIAVPAQKNECVLEYVLTRDQEARYQVAFYDPKNRQWKCIHYDNGRASFAYDPPLKIVAWTPIDFK